MRRRLTLAALLGACALFGGNRPETWYHVIGGNFTKEGLTADLEALKAAGFGGIQFFHGQVGRAAAWEGVPEQVPCLSAKWDRYVTHAAEECARLGLTFKMQNCPGWSMSGGPWIAPSNAMRRLAYERREGMFAKVPSDMPVPAGCRDAESDWRDICYLAFPTPAGDTGKGVLAPAKVTYENPSYEIAFAAPVTIRTLELPSPSELNHDWSYNPETHVRLENLAGKAWRTVLEADYPQGCWQDNVPVSFACREATAKKWRLTVSSPHAINVRHVRYFSGARLDNWEGLAGWVLRGTRTHACAEQDKAAYVDRKAVRLVTPGEALPREDRWTILRVGHVNMKKKNAPAPPEATGWECDKLDPRGIESNFAAYIGRLAKGPLAGGKLKGMIVDSWECERQTWTARMETYFREYNGYDVRTILPAVFGWVLTSPEETQRLLLAWRRTISGLITRNYYGRMAALAHAAGLTVAYETSFGDVIPGDLLAFWKYCDEPMCEFWQPYTPAQGSVGHPNFKPVRPCVSAAHLYGKRRVACESFTSTRLTWNENFRDLKEQAARHFARGVTHLVFHTCTHTPQTDGRVPGTSFGGFIGTPFIRGETWWPYLRSFTDWVAACGAFLERGRAQVDVLRYLGDTFEHKPDERDALPEGFKDDYLNQDALITRLAVRDGRFVLPDGMSYAVLWIPDGTFLLPETQARLEDLARQGGRIVRGTAAAAVAGLKPQITYRAAPPLGSPGYGATLLWYARRDGATDGFFTAADEKGFRGTATFATQHGARTLALDLAPYETLLLEFTAAGVRDVAPQARAGAWREKPVRLREAPVSIASWRLAFPPGWGADRPVALTNLVAWKDLPGVSAEGRAFSGTARYETAFTLGERPAAPLFLDLGRVCDFARVTVNGHPVATLWAAPYRCDVAPFVRAGENALAVEVTSTWFNRLAWDFNQPPEKRKTWTVWHIAPRTPPCLKPRAPLADSGLLGPVRFLKASDPATIALATRGAEGSYTIVLPPEAGAVRRYAAEELRDWTARMTGVTLPIAAAGTPGRRILFDDAPAAWGEDAFRLTVKGGDLHIVASAARGALYGVYELLETYGGIGWFSVRRTVVPQREAFEIPDDLDLFRKPAFVLREALWYGAEDGDFAARLRLTGNRSRLKAKHGGHPCRFGRGLGNCHTFAQLLPVSQYGAAHPEYFAWRGGTRVVTPEKDVQRAMQPCLTHPDVLAIVTSNVLAAIRRDPAARYYGVSQNDNTRYCECPACAAVDAEEGSHAGTLVRFVNAVAAAVEREFPDKIIETLAYQYTRKPPKKTRLRKNVMPCLCSIECDFAHPLATGIRPENVAFRDDIRGWAAQTDQLYVWDYTTAFAHYLTALPNVGVLRDNLRFFRDNGVVSMFEQGAYQGDHGELAELKTWLLAKWMWDPELPAEPLLDRFLTGYYGAAAPQVKAYLALLQDAVRRAPERAVGIWTTPEAWFLSEDLLDRAAALWQAAAERTKGDPEASYAVRMSALSVDYMRLMRAKGVYGEGVPFHVRRTRQLSAEALLCADLARRVAACLRENPAIRLAESKKTDGARRRDLEKILAAGNLWKDFTPADAVTLEEDALKLLRPGTWGEVVQDPTASKGACVKLYNTHGEWCLQLPLNALAFDPGVTYAARVRVKVVRDRGKGAAFSAGIYDGGEKRLRAAVSCRAETVTSGAWLWYDVGKWVPGKGQYLYVAPGAFDRKDRANPAVRAVYVDQVELRRAL